MNAQNTNNEEVSGFDLTQDVPRPPRPLETQEPPMEVAPADLTESGISADHNSRDVRLPAVKIVNPNSLTAITNGLRPGDIGLADKVRLVASGEHGVVTFVRAKRDYVEDLPFKSPVIPRVFSSLAAAHAEGFIEKAKMKQFPGRRYVTERAAIWCLFQVDPEVSTDLTCLEVPGLTDPKTGEPIFLTPGVWTVRSWAYVGLFKELMSDHSMANYGVDKAKNPEKWVPLCSRPWSVRTQMRMNPQGPSWNPCITKLPKHPTEFVAWCQGLIQIAAT